MSKNFWKMVAIEYFYALFVLHSIKNYNTQSELWKARVLLISSLGIGSGPCLCTGQLSEEPTTDARKRAESSFGTSVAAVEQTHLSQKDAGHRPRASFPLPPLCGSPGTIP